MTPSGWRWWWFVGVAHETTRMVYEPPIVRLRHAFEAIGRTIGETVIPAVQELARAFTRRLG